MNRIIKFNIMNVNYIKIFFLLLLITSNGFGQNNQGKLDDVSRIALFAYVPNTGDLKPSTMNILKNKLRRVITSNGLGSSNALNKQFIVAASIEVLGQEIVPSTPPMHAYNLGINLYVGNGKDGTLYASTYIETKGVDRSEQKAYNRAINSIRTKSPELKNLLENGKNKIIEYYNTQCDFILKEADNKAQRKDYDNAIYGLLMVPEVCKECYDKALDKSVEIYKMKLENECNIRIQEARVNIASDNYEEAANNLSGILPDVSCYDEALALLKEIEDHRCAEALGKAKGAWASYNVDEAGRYLGQVSADSKCYNEALSLGNEIKKKLKADEDREWDFKFKQQEDAVNLTSKSIEAVRQIGVTVGENLPDIDYKSIIN